MKEIIEPYFINNAHPDFALIYKKLPHHMVMIGNFIDKAEAEYFIKAANAYESLKAQDSKQQAALKVAREFIEPIYEQKRVIAFRDGHDAKNIYESTKLALLAKQTIAQIDEALK